MASRRNRIIYASQSVHAEGRVLYRVSTFGSTTTFNTTDLFELGQLNLTDVVDDSPDVEATIEGNDYGSIYSMATLFKVPTNNLHHNIRQSDGVSFFDTVSSFGDVSNGDLTESAYAGLPAASGTGIANIVIKDGPGGSPLRYYHGVQLIDAARECGVEKGVDIWSPIQTECALGTADNEIEFTKLLKDVFINRVEFNYQSADMSNENYTGETEQKQWLLNSARFLSWEEWRVGSLSEYVDATAFGAKTELQLSLPLANNVATLSDGTVAFLKNDSNGRPAILFTFVSGGGLSFPESKAVAVYDKSECQPTSLVEYFLYDSATNKLEYYENGLSSALSNVLPAGRSAFINGDKLFVFYAADAYAEEIGSASRPAGADSSYIDAKYFAPVGTEDVEDIGGVRQGQVEAYLVDPDLVVTSELTGATIGATSITFNNTVSSQVDLTSFIGLKVSIIEGPGKGGPAREITGATNSVSGDYNNGTLNLAGSAWATIRLVEDTAQVSTSSDVFVTNLCGLDNSYAGSSATVVVGSTPESVTIGSVDVGNKKLVLSPAATGSVDDGSDVLVSVEPTTASTLLIGGYELTLRLTSVNISADLTREALKEIGHLNSYARTITLPIQFTVAIETTASDLLTFANFAGKKNEYESGTLTDIDIVDLFAKDNMMVAIMIYQQTDEEAGGSGEDRRVLSADMFGDEYFVDGVRNVYDAVDGSLREYPVKTVLAKDLRITDENISTPLDGNATQGFSFRGTNEVTAIRGSVAVQYAVKTVESQGE